MPPVPLGAATTFGIFGGSAGTTNDGIRTVVNGDIGGGFGMKTGLTPEDALVCYAARKLGRPVKWTEDRRENLLSSNHSREIDCELEIACEKDGTIVALRGKAWFAPEALCGSCHGGPLGNVANQNNPIGLPVGAQFGLALVPEFNFLGRPTQEYIVTNPDGTALPEQVVVNRYEGDPVDYVSTLKTSSLLPAPTRRLRASGLRAS